MSPNEAQLRQALREGEGERPSADVIIWQARQQRAERRRRLTTIAAAVIVVGFVGGGTALLVHSSGGQESASSNEAPVVPSPRALGTLGPSRTPRTVGGSAKDSAPVGGTNNRYGSNLPSCPVQFPELMLPGGGGTDQFGAGQPLFPQPVASVRICVYSSGRVRSNETGELDGADASRLAGLLENGTTSIIRSCTHVPVVQQEIALYATDTSGKAERVVTVDLSCPYRTTNGTAVRYLDPSDLQALRAPDVPIHPVGSPIK